MGEYEAIKKDLADVKSDVRESLAGMRSDIKELTKALGELIRLDGDLGRVADMASRIGKEVDELAGLMRTQQVENDRRLRALETQQAGNNKSVGLFDGLVKYAVTLLFGLAIGAAMRGGV